MAQPQLTRAQLERHIEAARQLRAETLAAGTWPSNPFTGIVRLLRWVLAFVSTRIPFKA